MKKAISCVLVAVSACWVATSQMAQAEEVPWHNAFETNTVNVPIATGGTNEFGTWTAAEGEVAVVTNLDYSALLQAPKVNYPLTNDTRANVVVFSGAGLTNEVVGGEFQNVWVDMMIQPIQMDKPEQLSPAVSNSQMSMFVNTQGYVCVYHAILTNTTSSGFVPDRSDWTELNDGGFPAVGTDKWIRVTVKMDYNHPSGRPFFQLTVNNHPFTNAWAFKNVDAWESVDKTIYTNANLNGTWFLCANDNGYRINGVAFSGDGALDDLVVTNGPVDIQYLPEDTTIFVNNRTPQWWLQLYTNAEYSSYQLSITNDDTDVDHDGAKEYEEYVAGTIPVNSNSVLRILAGQVADGVGMIVWQSTTNMPDPNALHYVLQASTNLLDGVWSTIRTNNRAEGALTNFGDATRSPGFYRISFTNQ